MARTPPPKDEMHYDVLQQDALRGVVKMALKRAASPQGLPGDHHFYITFKTGAPGVSGPKELLSQFPDEMNIVIQHRFWDLAPGESFFAVTLQFSGKPQRLSIPYAAVTRFYDPSVQYGLQFEASGEDAEPPEPQDEAETPALNNAAPAEAPGSDDEPKVVSLDTFRKK